MHKILTLAKQNQLEYGKYEQLLLFMSMVCDYVTELRPPTDLLFIPHITYEYGDMVE
jgi:hypothetical protein